MDSTTGGMLGANGLAREELSAVEGSTAGVVSFLAFLAARAALAFSCRCLCALLPIVGEGVSCRDIPVKVPTVLYISLNKPCHFEKGIHNHCFTDQEIPWNWKTSLKKDEKQQDKLIPCLSTEPKSTICTSTLFTPALKS